jgi:hypothetical protein
MFVNSKASPTRVVASNNSYVVIPPPMTPSTPNGFRTQLWAGALCKEATPGIFRVVMTAP